MSRGYSFMSRRSSDYPPPTRGCGSADKGRAPWLTGMHKLLCPKHLLFLPPLPITRPERDPDSNFFEAPHFPHLSIARGAQNVGYAPTITYDEPDDARCGKCLPGASPATARRRERRE